MGDLSWALDCQQPLYGVLEGEPGPPLTRTALGVSAPGVCEMSTEPQGTKLIEFQEMNEHSRVTLIAEGWTIQGVTPEDGITVTSDVPNVADGFFDNTDYTLTYAGPDASEPITMQYRSGSGQVQITLSSP